MTDTCTEHLPCRLPAPLLPSHVEVVERLHPSGRVSYLLMVGDDFIGSVQDSGFTAHDGRWISRWEGFAGGNAVPLSGRDRDRNEAVQAVIEHCGRSSFHWRLALHPC